LADIFKDLEENGIDIQLQTGTVTIYFVLSLVVGDNLALNTLLGFSESFSANYYCRICKMTKSDCQHELTIHQSLIRNKTNFKSDLISQSFETTGIKFNSVFNKLKHFHVTDNISVDVMHDFFEGICNYVVCSILLKYISDSTIALDLDALNDRKDFFDYGCILVGNLSVKKITKYNLEAKKLKMSSAEMMTFVLLLPLMIGDLVAKNDPYWKLLLTLVDLIEICLKSSFDEDLLKKLDDVIKSHNKMYMEIFTKNLKPKFHLLFHYTDVIRRCGPLRHLWSFVFESKNREVKSYATVCLQKKNLSLSLSYKARMKFSTFLLEHCNGFPDSVNISESKMFDLSYVENEPYYSELCTFINQYLHSSPASSNQESNICIFFKIKFKNTLYEKDYYISVETNKILNFCKISAILAIGNEFFLIAKKVLFEGYNEHFRAFIVGKEEAFGEIQIINIKEIMYLPINMHKISTGDLAFKLRII
jgi:hypothetical protein